MSHRAEKIAEIIKQKAAEFILETSDTKSLVTVTRAEVSGDYRYATIFITTYPDKQAQEILSSIRSHIGELKEYLAKYTRLGRIPQLTIEIDEGEKKRQRIDALSNEV